MPYTTSQSLMPKACESCRLKKIKCDRCHPCSSCIRSNKECLFTPKKALPRGRAGGRKPQITHLRERVTKLELVIHYLQARTRELEPEPGKDESVNCESIDTTAERPGDATGADSVSTFWTVLTAEVSEAWWH